MDWTAADLALLRRLNRTLGSDLKRLAIRFERMPSEVNQALDALLGRTPEAAAEALAWPSLRQDFAAEAAR